MGFFDLPTVGEMNAKPRPMPKGKSRLQVETEEKRVTVVTEKDFKAAVWTRDQSRCRKCKRKVIKTMSRVENRGEVHHIHGRGKDLRYEARAAVLLCLTHHEQVTGKVNERWAIVPTKTFRMRDEDYTDARYPVAFKRIA